MHDSTAARCTIEDMARMSKHGHRDCLRFCTSLNQTLRSPDCPVRGNADDVCAVRCCYRGSKSTPPFPPPKPRSSLSARTTDCLVIIGSHPSFERILHNYLSSPITNGHGKHTKLSHDVLGPKTYAKKDDSFLHLLSSL